MGRLLLLLFVASWVEQVACFTPIRPLPNEAVALSLHNNLEEPDEPFFQMQQIPTATSSSRLDHVVDCAENGECDVEEMTAMIEGEFDLGSSCFTPSHWGP